MTIPQFFQPTMITLEKLSDKSGAGLVCNDVNKDAQISGASPIESASNGQISFVDNPKYIKYLASTTATAVFCQEKYLEAIPKNVAALICEKPYDAYAKALALLYPSAMRPLSVTGEQGISKLAYVSDTASIEAGATIEAGAVVGRNASVGTGSLLLPGAVIGENVQIGRNSVVGSNATVVHAFVGDNVIIHNGVQIGQDGFGFSMGPGGHAKVPQIGRVIIQDGVEIGANSTIDRGANRDTIIGEGTKIDNLVQIGHNVVIGRHCVIVGLAGVAGSATLGDYVVVAGQAGIVGHSNIGDGAQIGGGSGVHGDVEPGAKVMGYPAIPANQWMREASKILLAAKRKKKKS